MKWFKHHSDAYSNLKHQQVMAEFGLEGYGFYWICIELVAQQGDNFRIKSDKNWKKALSFVTHKNIDDVDKYLEFFASVNLIDEKALKNNDLFIPKMKEHQDEYTESKRRKSRQYRENIGLEEIRIDKNRTEENMQRFEMFWSEYPNKKAKSVAQKSWYKINPDEKLFSAIMDGLKKAKCSQQWVKDGGQFVPHPSTWLNQQRWNDEVEIKKQTTLKI